MKGKKRKRKKNNNKTRRCKECGTPSSGHLCRSCWAKDKGKTVSRAYNDRKRNPYLRREIE